MVSHRRAIGMHINSTIEGMLRLCRSCKAPTTHIPATLVPALVSTILVTTIGSRCDLHKNIIILTLLQTAYVYLDGWKHASVKDQTKISKLLLNNESYEVFSFQNLLKLKVLKMKTDRCRRNLQIRL